MNLDRGIATIYTKRNVAQAGEKPRYEDSAYWWSWYAELHFETSAARPTGAREEIRTDARIRVLQNRSIGEHDRVELAPNGEAVVVYEVTRAYHGVDEESGELITDLTLEVYTP